MPNGGTNIILILVVIAVAVTVAAWLIHFILRIRKTQKAYKEIMAKRQDDEFKYKEATENETDETRKEKNNHDKN